MSEEREPMIDDRSLDGWCGTRAEQFPWFFFRIVWKSPEGWQHKNY